VAGSAVPAIGASRSGPGTFSALIRDYYAKSNFRTMEESTQADTRRSLEAFRAEHGHKRVAHLRRDHIERMMDANSSAVAANAFRKRLRWLLDFAVSQNVIETNPALSVKRRKTKTRPHHTWTEEQLEKFRARHPIGTRARLAFCLMLCLGQRGRSDARRMGRQHIKDGAFHFIAKKNKAELTIPIDDELAAAIAAMPADNLALLVTARGQPFTPAGFGNWFAQEVKAAGLPAKCVAHGLRKARGRQLAERGATEKEIMAVIGDKDPRAAAIYTAGASQKLLAEAATAKLRGPKGEQALANPAERFANGGSKIMKFKES